MRLHVSTWHALHTVGKYLHQTARFLSNIFLQHLSKDISSYDFLQIQPWLQWVGFPFPFQAPALCWKEVALWWRYLPWRLHRWPKVWGPLWICGIDSDCFRHKPCSLTIFDRDPCPIFQSMMKGGLSFLHLKTQYLGPMAILRLIGLLEWNAENHSH